MYKIQDDSILRLSDGATIPQAPENRDYAQFRADIKEQGSGIIEGADVVEPDYITLRTGPDGYAPLPEQLDILTKEGVEALQTLNNAVKEKFPKTITGGTRIAPLPDWVKNIAMGQVE